MANNVSQGETIIAQGVRVEGDFRSRGDVYIEGELSGSLHTDNNLRIGESARIQAEVSADTATIAGEVRGNIRIADRLDLLETSVIYGDIQAETLSISPGSKVNGRITMGASVDPVSEMEDAT